MILQDMVASTPPKLCRQRKTHSLNLVNVADRRRAGYLKLPLNLRNRKMCAVIDVAHNEVHSFCFLHDFIVSKVKK